MPNQNKCTRSDPNVWRENNFLSDRNRWINDWQHQQYDKRLGNAEDIVLWARKIFIWIDEKLEKGIRVTEKWPNYGIEAKGC